MQNAKYNENNEYQTFNLPFSLTTWCSSAKAGFWPCRLLLTTGITASFSPAHLSRETQTLALISQLIFAHLFSSPKALSYTPTRSFFTYTFYAPAQSSATPLPVNPYPLQIQVVSASRTPLTTCTTSDMLPVSSYAHLSPSLATLPVMDSLLSLDAQFSRKPGWKATIGSGKRLKFVPGDALMLTKAFVSE